MANDNLTTQDYQRALSEFLKDRGINDRQMIDGIFRGSTGPISDGLSEMFSGINHEATPAVLPVNKEHYGLVFATRPIMNMTRANIMAERSFAPLLDTDPRSIGYMIRAIFDYRLGYPNPTNEILKPAFFDNRQAFIPLFTNTCVGLTGFPDANAPVHTATEGLQKETFGHIDGPVKNYGGFSINTTFRNVITDPITFMMYVWILYGSNVHANIMVPWPDMLFEDECDYNTRIYRITLDQSKRYVRRIAAIGAGFPTGAATGAAFDFTSERAWAIDNSTISVPFQAFGAMVYDPILVYEFNQTVIFFNNSMQDGVREKTYVKIEEFDRPYVRNKGYPRINPETMELEWWISPQTLADAMLITNKLNLKKGVNT